MRRKLIAKLLFGYFYSEDLVTHVTGWHPSDLEKDNKLAWPTFDDPFSEKDESGFYNEFETDTVEYMYRALEEISNHSLEQKVSALESSIGSANRLSVLDERDYIFWARKSIWTPTEMAMLSIGLRPTGPHYERILHISDNHKKNCRPIDELIERLDLYYSALNSEVLESDGHVLEIADWLERLEFPVPSGLLEAVRRFHGPNKKIDLSESEKTIDPREKTSLLQIILVMAMDCYKFDPKSKRIDMAKEIEERAASNGMKISRETIRNHLKAAGEHLVGKWNPD